MEKRYRKRTAGIRTKQIMPAVEKEKGKPGIIFSILFSKVFSMMQTELFDREKNFMTFIQKDSYENEIVMRKIRDYIELKMKSLLYLYTSGILS